MKIFLTGKKGSGKSTLIMNVIKNIKYDMGGFLTQKENDFIVFSNIKGEEYFRFKVEEDPDKIASLFDKYGVELLLESYINSDLIIMDELGFLERNAKKFEKAVFNIIESEKYVLGVVKNYIKNGFYKQLKSNKNVKIINLDNNDRQLVLKKIRALFDEKI